VRQLVLSETLNIGTGGVDVLARVAVASAGATVADSSGTPVAAGSGVFSSAVSESAVSATRAFTVAAMAVSANPAGTSVELGAERLHARAPATSVAIATLKRFPTPEIPITVERSLKVYFI